MQRSEADLSLSQEEVLPAGVDHVVFPYRQNIDLRVSLEEMISRPSHDKEVEGQIAREQDRSKSPSLGLTISPKI